jgi:hypothetical protein
MGENELHTTLTEKEIAFCELFINGIAPYCGNAAKCYEDVFHVTSNKSQNRAKKLFAQKHIRSYIEQLEKENAEYEKYIKNRISENLLHIMEETATAAYTDKWGEKLSPAPLRSVSVQAAKALMEIHPIKEASISKVNIEGGSSGITFNVIVPSPEQSHKETND